MQTPSKKGVRWAFDVSNSPFGGQAEPSTPETSTSSLAYVNSQIIAHGFARAALDLSDLGRDEQNRVVKCILGMLSQRVDDMTRAEDLSSRLRTLSYEHERLGNMLRSAKSQVIQAEKESEAAKTKTSALTKELSSANTAHTRTSAHLAQQTSAIAALRQASTALDRKREQDMARLKERWQKLASEQSKLGSVGSGMVCANYAVVDGNEQYIGSGETVDEGAMRDAVEARERLTEENDVFREVLGKLGGVVGECLKERDVKDVKIPTTASLFQPPSMEEDAGPALNAYRTLRDLIHQLAISTSSTSAAYDEEERALSRAKAEEHRVEIRKWEEQVEGLEREIARLKGELAASNDFAEKGRVLIEQMANDRKIRERKEEEHAAGEAVVLAAQRQELEDERAKFTDAAIRLARERSDFEAERLQFSEEKRMWTIQKLEAEQAPVLEPQPEPEAEPLAQLDTNMDPETDMPPPATKGNTSLGDALRTVLKAEKDAEKKKRKEERGRLMKPSSPAKTKIGKRGREGEDAGKEKKRRAPPQPVFVKGATGQVVVGSSAQSVAGPSSAGPSTEPGADSTAPSQPVDAPTSPKSKPTTVPATPRSLHPAAQRARARNYAPAVPSPLSRILTMAASPEDRRIEPGPDAGGLDLGGAGIMSPPRLNGGKSSPGRGGAKSPGRGGVKSPGRPKSGLAVKFAAAAAAKAKEAPKPEPKVISLADKGKGKAREEEEREKDEGRDLDAILAAPSTRAGASRPGSSRAVPKVAAVGKPMRVAVKRGATPRKAAVGGVRAKRRG
ncbi:actinin-binding protein, afadin and alpha [Ceratobasidium sp. AG-Ba]|nr:actinin-binding protein, afadin and alpha [Ceratobasidium sp. AG-Ba]